MPTGVVLLNLGGPDSPDAIEPFLLNLFGDREIIPLGGPLSFLLQGFIARRIVRKRLPEVRLNYARIGGRSPLLDRTREQARALEARLNARGLPGGPFRVVIAMRYWHPTTDEALAELRGHGISRLVGLTLYPQYSIATTGSSAAELTRGIARSGHPFDFSLIDRYARDPAYLDALAGSVRAVLDPVVARAGRERTALLFSAHSLPEWFVRRGDPYVDEIKSTMGATVARLIDPPESFLSFQSRTGPVRWVGPGTDEVIAEIARRGKKALVVVPIAFVSDHIETLFEIGMLFRDIALKCGIEEFHRVNALNDDPAFIEALAGLVVRHLGG